jgi:hypothetical protein
MIVWLNLENILEFQMSHWAEYLRRAINISTARMGGITNQEKEFNHETLSGS